MKIMVTGSRGWTDERKIQQVLYAVADEVAGRQIEFFHGGARGVDTIAAEIASYLGWVVVEFPADWEGKGKRAGIWRNSQMLDENPSRVIAFWDGSSKGTRHAFGEAIKRGIATDIYVRRGQ